MANRIELKNLETVFDEQTSEDFMSLLSQCKQIEGDEKVTAVIKDINNNGRITFRQWKFLKATLKEQSYNPYKRI
jgi:hypothetical protein